ncbi:helix-turn-helix domain-containing protein [Xylella taiwanensis]|uniref:helix-turn-helix domain-containing protein n=1 Tax=Xylella taiwanensis TaxID=1444770 RepID=UPI003CCD0881
MKGRRWTQQEAADVLGMTQPKLSNMRRGQFRDISEAKMLQCLARLGRQVQMVASPVHRTNNARYAEVVFVASPVLTS